MSDLAFEILVILGLLACNGVFAMSELAIVTARKVRLEQRADNGDRGAQAALALAKEPTQFLSTIQVGITLIGVLAGAFGGATIAGELAVLLATVPPAAPHAEGLAFGIVVAGITYLSLIIGEMIPKRVALSHPERVAAIVARPMRLLARLASPAVALLTGPTNLLLRVFGFRASTEPSLTHGELRALIEQGAESGVVDVTEHEIVESVFRLGDRQVADVMVARTQMSWIDLDAGIEDVRRRVMERARPRYLVCRGEVDHVAGVVYAADLLQQSLEGGHLSVEPLLVQPLFVPAVMPALDLLDRFKESRLDVAVALDEQGGVLGMVTIDDLVTEVVGQIPEEGETIRADIQPQGHHAWVVEGDVLIEDLEAALDLAEIPERARRHVRTVAGFFMAQARRVPALGDTVVWDGLHFEVTAMDGRRIERLLVTRTPPPGATGEVRR